MLGRVQHEEDESGTPRTEDSGVREVTLKQKQRVNDKSLEVLCPLLLQFSFTASPNSYRMYACIPGRQPLTGAVAGATQVRGCFSGGGSGL